MKKKYFLIFSLNEINEGMWNTKCNTLSVSTITHEKNVKANNNNKKKNH